MEINVDNLPRLFCCKVCNKQLSSYKSLWRHNNKFHNDDVVIGSHNVVKNVVNDIHHVVSTEASSINTCVYCKKKFQNRSNRWRHEKICKVKKEELEKPIVPVKEEIINKQINNTNNTNNTNSHNNNSYNTTNNNNNGVINNITINAFGKEDLSILGPLEIKKLIKNDNPLVDIIGLLNFNENFPENHSFCNTSLEGNYVSVLNTDNNKVEKINKNEFYDKVLNNSFSKIDQLSSMLELDDTFKETLKDKYKKHLDKKIEHTKSIFFTDKVYKNCYKTNINEMSYNKKNLVLDTWSKLKEPNDDDSVSTLATEDSLLTDDEI